MVRITAGLRKELEQLICFLYGNKFIKKKKISTSASNIFTLLEKNQG